MSAPRGALGLCPDCRGRLRRWPETGCATCGLPLAAGVVPPGYRCAACRRRPPPFDALVAAWTYQPPLDAVVAALKFRRLDYLGRQLGRVAGDLLAPRLAACDLAVPLPLHWRRRLSRGYDQAELIARALADALGLRCSRALRRRRSTRPQSGLERQARLRNVVGAFALRHGAACRDRRVLLVDDVATTAATLRQAAACLRQGGARSVVAAVLARTPPPGNGPSPSAPSTSQRGPDPSPQTDRSSAR